MKKSRGRVNERSMGGENSGKSEERIDTNTFNSSCEPAVGVGVFT